MDLVFLRDFCLMDKSHFSHYSPKTDPGKATYHIPTVPHIYLEEILMSASKTASLQQTMPDTTYNLKTKQKRDLAANNVELHCKHRCF